jgi:fatty-acyl-CoA synthase
VNDRGVNEGAADGRRGRHSAAEAWRRALEATAPIADNPSVTLPVVIEELAGRFGSTPALVSEAETLSFRGLADRVDRYARWALAQGVAAGDVVALLLANCPDYLAIWLGITRVGGVVALINTNLVGAALKHSLEIVAPRQIVVGAELIDAMAPVLPQLDPGIGAWVHGGEGLNLPRVDAETGGMLNSSGFRAPSIRDRALYIYTSGTTGLPKAASVSHYRLMQWTRWFAGLIDPQPSDRMYNCLPMYHSVGGVVATGAALLGGGSVLIRERFSASRFWDDIAEWDCTLFQYIGELCRYLVNTAPHPRETQHKLRLCCGNGLRPDVWEPFQERFHIPRILEFYAATEGPFSLFNCEGKPGAIGKIPPFLAHRFPVALIKFDIEAGEPVRNDDGFCVRCAADEPGEAIGQLPGDRATLRGQFEGYTDKVASEQKLLRNVFAAGDSWYRTGDLMRRDRAGYYYFVDRIGDTFRWKGENVSTTEIGEAIALCPGVVEAVVYGVAVPGADGRAGMAAIVTGEGFDLGRLHAHLAERLPDYARPVFLRIREAIDITGTFKPQKQALLRDGCDPDATDDAMYLNDRSAAAFVPLDAALYGRVQSGDLRL